MIDLFFRGGPVMYPLLACSILVLTVIIERLLFWITVDVNRDMKLIEDVLELCRQGDWEGVRARVSGSKVSVKLLLANS